jgi:hypothetical protein
MCDTQALKLFKWFWLFGTFAEETKMTANKYKHGRFVKTDLVLVEDKTALLAKLLNEINSAYSNTVEMHTEELGKDIYQMGR